MEGYTLVMSISSNSSWMNRLAFSRKEYDESIKQTSEKKHTSLKVEGNRCLRLQNTSKQKYFKVLLSYCASHKTHQKKEKVKRLSSDFKVKKNYNDNRASL